MVGADSWMLAPLPNAQNSTLHLRTTCRSRGHGFIVQRSLITGRQCVSIHYYPYSHSDYRLEI